MSAIFNRDSKAMSVMTWLANMVHVQVLWVLFTLFGLVIGGLFPATFSMHAVLRKLILEKDSFSINKVFWENYKRDFIKSNMIGFSLLFAGLLVRYYLALSLTLGNSLSPFYTLLSILLSIFFVSFILWFIPVYTHFNVSQKAHLKTALILMFSFPFHTFGMFFAVILFYWSTVHFPVLLPFVSVAILAYLITYIVLDAVKRSEEKLNTSP